MAQYDLTTRLAPHLDRHFMIPVLEWVQTQKFYPEKDIIQANIDILNHTKLLDSAAQEYQKLHGTEPRKLFLRFAVAAMPQKSQKRQID